MHELINENCYYADDDIVYVFSRFKFELPCII